MRTKKPKNRHCFLLYTDKKNKEQVEQMLKDRSEELSIRSYIISNSGAKVLVSLRLHKSSYPIYLSKLLDMEFAKHDPVDRCAISLEYDKAAMRTSDPSPIVYGIPPCRQEVLFLHKSDH